MPDQCPQCYGHEIVKVRRLRGLFVWIGLSLLLNAALLFVILYRRMENIVPWIVGFVALDMLISLPLMTGLRRYRSFSAGTLYRCLACGHTWSESLGAPGLQQTTGTTNRALSSSTAGFRMVVDDVFYLKGRGTVVTGTVTSGTLTQGETVEIDTSSGFIRTVVDSIEVFRRPIPQARAGDHVGLLLSNVPPAAVNRGDVVRKVG